MRKPLTPEQLAKIRQLEDEAALCRVAHHNAAVALAAAEEKIVALLSEIEGADY